MLGLSQLYQIRGRVGRSDVTAHAYLFYPDRRELTEEARHRLSTLADYTELGSGYRIAMRDLELRGAGNLLGDEQSGHVAAIGFELYCELLADAVDELQGGRRRRGRGRCESTPRWTPTCRPTTSRWRRSRSTSTAGWRWPAVSPSCASCEAEVADRFGPLPGAGGQPVRDPGGAAGWRPSWARVRRAAGRKGDGLARCSSARPTCASSSRGCRGRSTRWPSVRSAPAWSRRRPVRRPICGRPSTCSLLYSTRAASSRRNVCYAPFSHRFHTYVPGRGSLRVRFRQQRFRVRRQGRRRRRRRHDDHASTS